tara:strand:- start:54 stop:365 length:312 start_codon:yes stop_codon:yes gene_type:complete
MNRKKKIIYIVSCILFSNLFASNYSIFFIYNSKDDFYRVIYDTFHKSLNPGTYPFELCKLTYNTFAKKSQWKDPLSKLEYPHHFLYKEDSFIVSNEIKEFNLD